MSAIEDIKSRLDIIEVISSYIPLQKAGRTYKAVCPFHSEKTPSFVVYPESQSWRCFGQCAEGGDVISFIMKHEGKSFAEVLQALAQRTGVVLEKHKSADRQKEDQYTQVLLGILKEAAQFYQDCLAHSPGAAYVNERGLTASTVQTFGLGYAPNEWNALLKHLEALGYARADLLAAGVVVEHEENQRLFDRFRDRFIIPIRDVQGRVIGFGARALSNERQPKYLNSPQSRLFDKSHILFGFDQARRAIRETETAIVVEGYLDVMQAHQAGYKNVVATMGTALTKEHLQTLGKYAQKLILALDADAAGIKATLRGLEVAREELGSQHVQVMDMNGVMRQAGQLKIDIRILKLPHSKDPDEFLRKAPGDWPAVVANAQALHLFLIELAMAELPPNASVQERERAALRLLPLLVATEDSVVRTDHLQELSLRLRLDPKAMVAMANQQRRIVRPQNPRPPKFGPSHKAPWAPPPPADSAKIQLSLSPSEETRALERHCLSLLLHEPARLFEANRILRQIGENSQHKLYLGLESQDFNNTDYQSIFQLLQKASQQITMDTWEYFQGQLDDTLQQVLAEVMPEQELVQDNFYAVLVQLRLARLKREAEDFLNMLDEAYDTADQEVVRTHRLAYNEVLQAMKKVQQAYERFVRR
jgi:DNA primase